MASVTIGDYKYTVYSGNPDYVQVKVVDDTKTSYEDMLSTVKINNITYPVTSLYDCFRYCESLVKAPIVSSNATNMRGCFSYCYALKYPPVIPSGVIYMDECFTYCNLAYAPIIPDSVIDMESCFENCYPLKEPPVLPPHVENLCRCFAGTDIIYAPEIPSLVTNMDFCFMACYDMSGDVIVNNTPASYDGAFQSAGRDADYPICIINGGNANASTWRTIASQGDNIYLACHVSDYACLETTTTTAKLIPTDPEQCSANDFSMYTSQYFWDETHNITGLSFEYSTNLTTSPKIPAFIDDMTNCFRNCTNLKGIIRVSNEPSTYDNIFTGTSNRIIIVDDNPTPSTVWQSIANTYSNVIYGQLQMAYVYVRKLGNSVILSDLSETNDEQSTKTGVYVVGIDFSDIPDDWQCYIVEFAI